MTIMTTWGDPFYVGLTEIVIFDELGERVVIEAPYEQVEMSGSAVEMFEKQGDRDV